SGATMRNIDPKRVCIGGSGAGEVDIVCVVPAAQALTDAAKSVSKIVFTQDDGQSYACTATLVTDPTSSNPPYLFTASHCLNSQATATTMNLYWFYDAIACRSLN